ncbi:MAG TPA: hypothetical protein VKE88_01025 [Candidatus Nanoarchaeia archaeon]|nr:hypothetical protein [Candidatus Nanoarchaeia archaeon]
MKKILAILCIFALLMTACASQSTQKTETSGPQKPDTETSTGSSSQAKLDQVEQETLAKNDKSQEFFLPLTFKSGKVGEQVAFGAIINPLNKPREGYFARISFVEGRDKNSNKIEVDKDTVTRWLRQTQTEDFTIEAGASHYFPIVATIGSEIKPGVKTVPGSYQYEVQIYAKVGNEFSDMISGMKKNVYLRVE